jgi:hypothetical protein
MAILPWALRYEWQGIQLEDYPYVQDYIERLTARPAIQKLYRSKLDESESKGWMELLFQTLGDCNGIPLHHSNFMQPNAVFSWN